MAKKMNKPDPSSASDSGGFDLTSMIDVTFLLLIFFMVCTEMSDSAKSKMEVARVDNGEPDDTPQPGRLLINVLQDGRVQVMLRDYTEPELNELLKKHYNMSVGRIGDISEKPIMIRSDRRAKYKDVQKVMQMCMSNRLGKISFTALAGASAKEAAAGGGQN